MSSYLSSKKLHSVHASPLSAGGGGGHWGVSLLTDFRKGVAWQDLRRWLLGKIGVTFFRGFADFAKKIKLRSETFNDKKGL